MLFHIFVGVVIKCGICNKQKQSFNHQQFLWTNWKKVVIFYNFLSVKWILEPDSELLIIILKTQEEKLQQSEKCSLQLKAFAVSCACVLVAYRVTSIKYSKYLRNWKQSGVGYSVNVLCSMEKLVQFSLKVFPISPSFEDNGPLPLGMHFQGPAIRIIGNLMLWT